MNEIEKIASTIDLIAVGDEDDIIVVEDVERQMPQLLQQLRKVRRRPVSDEEAESFIRKLAEVDPTDRKSYVGWLIKHSNEDNFEEDLDRIANALKKWETYKKQQLFKDMVNEKGMQSDIQRNHWRDVEDVVNAYQETHGEADKKERKAIGRLSMEGVQERHISTRMGKWPVDFTVLHITNADSLKKWSDGTNWCTTQQGQADSYVDGGGTWIFLRKDAPETGPSGQYFMADYDFNQLKNSKDREPHVISPKTDLMLAAFAQEVQLPAETLRGVNKYRETCPPYDGRPE